MSQIATKQISNVLYTIFNNNTACVGDITKSTKPTAFQECPKEPPELEIQETVEYNGALYTVTSLYKCAFYRCELKSLKLPNTIKYIGNNAIDLCLMKTEFQLPNFLEMIGEYGLSNHRYMSINIPKSLSSIGKGAFAYNGLLETIKVDPENKYFNTDGQGILYDSRFKYLIQAPAVLTELTIPETVIKIYASALTNLKIEELVIPVSVKKIDAGLASFCSKLKRVYIRGNIKPFIEGNYFQNDQLDLFSYSGALPLHMNIFQDIEVKNIVVCHGYQGYNVSQRNFQINEYCQSYPIDKTLCYCKHHYCVSLFLSFISIWCII